jgi:Xaa-Pro aminopeptidase
MSTTSTSDLDAVRGFIRDEQTRAASEARRLPFSTEEYADRRRRLQRHMREQGVDVFVITSPDTMCWLTGYSSRWYRAGASTALPPCQCIVLQVESGIPFMIDTGFHEQLVRITSCIEDLRSLPNTGLTREPGAPEFVAFLIDNLAAERWLGGTVGLEAYSWVPSPAVWDVLVERLKGRGCRVLDVSGMARAARRQKSPAEIAYIERAQRAVDAGVLALQRHARPGMTGLEGWKHFVAGVADAGGEPAAIQDAIFGGPPEPMAHLLSTRKPIERGEYFHIDVAAAFERYHARCTRVLAFEPPRPEVGRLTEIAGGALAVLRESRAGQPFSQLKGALRDYFASEGFAEDEFFAGGYELGVSFAPDWVGELLWSAGDADDDSVIPEGMVTNFESVAFIAVVDTVVFEADRARTLSTVPTRVLIAGE